MVIGRRLGSGGMRRPGACHCDLEHWQPWLEGKQECLFILSHSLIALVSGSFWWGEGGAPLLVPMGWSILECFGEPGEAVSTCGDGMKRCTHTSDEKRGLSKRGHGLGVSWGTGQSAGLSVRWGWNGCS